MANRHVAPILIDSTGEGARWTPDVVQARWPNAQRLPVQPGKWELLSSQERARVATASADGTAKIWDAATGQELRTLSGHDADVYGVAFSGGGTRVATASVDGTAKIWDAATGQELLTLSGHEDYLYGVAFSGDGTRVATASQDGTAKIWAREIESLLERARAYFAT